MRYREYPTPAWLQPYAHLVWGLELETTPEFGPPERILPDGIAEAVFHFREPMLDRFYGESLVREPRSFVVFQTRRFLEIQPAGCMK